MKAYEIVGGYAHICDCCEKDDGRPTLYWKEQDFDLCYACLSSLYYEYVSKFDKQDELIIVKRKIISEALRNKIFKRDSFKCGSCGSEENLQIDHIVPFSKGGLTTIKNLQTLCKTCNVSKGNK